MGVKLEGKEDEPPQGLDPCLTVGAAQAYHLERAESARSPRGLGLRFVWETGACGPDSRSAALQLQSRGPGPDSR